MFFSTEVSVTFDSIRDVMRAYDDWKLMMQDVNTYGSKIIFVLRFMYNTTKYIVMLFY